MGIFKIVTTVLIGVMMLIYFLIWASLAKQREYVWVWVLMEIVYVCSLICIWG